MLFNEILSARFNRLMQAFLPIDEQSGSPTIAPELNAGFTLESERPEWEFIKGEILRSCGVRQNADAANQSAVFLHNPAGSRALIVLEQLWISVNTAGTIQLQTGVVTAFTGCVENVRDSRWTVGQGVGAVTFTSGAAAIGTQVGCIGQLVVPANQVVVLKLPMILAPNSQLQVNTTANNINLDVTFVWRERVAQPAELV